MSSTREMQVIDQKMLFIVQKNTNHRPINSCYRLKKMQDIYLENGSYRSKNANHHPKKIQVIYRKTQVIESTKEMQLTKNMYFFILNTSLKHCTQNDDDAAFSFHIYLP